MLVLFCVYMAYILYSFLRCFCCLRKMLQSSSRKCQKVSSLLKYL